MVLIGNAKKPCQNPLLTHNLAKVQLFEMRLKKKGSNLLLLLSLVRLFSSYAKCRAAQFIRLTASKGGGRGAEGGPVYKIVWNILPLYLAHSTVFASCS